MKRQNRHPKMKKYFKKYGAVVTLLLAALAVCTVFVVRGIENSRAEPEQETDSGGWIEVDTGGSTKLIRPAAGVKTSRFTSDDFAQNENGEPVYIGSDYTSMRGIDVSSMQGDIDWQAVADSGVEFAVLRIGGRGYVVGDVYEDEYFTDNLSEAKAAGLKVGVYFFSQAISVEEAEEEAAFVLEKLDGASLELPVFFDWERLPDANNARTLGLSNEMITQCAVSFSAAIKLGGYTPGVYFNQDLAYSAYDLSEVKDCQFWFALPGNYPYLYYEHSVWQYSFTGSVPGINGDCDMDLLFIEK